MIQPVATKTVPHVDRRFGIEISDPYRWLEDGADPEVDSWVRAQTAATEAWLARVPDRAAIRARLDELSRYERWGMPVKRGGRTFALWNDGTREQPVLCELRDDDAPRVLVDPAGWSNDGTTAIIAFVPNDDGSLVAFAVAEDGSDWNEWLIYDVAAGTVLDDRLTRVRFSSVEWAKGARVCFYSRIGEDDRARLLAHRLGDPQDTLVYERADHPEWRFQPVVTEDGRWLVIYLFDQTGGPNGIACMDLTTGRIVEVPDGFRARLAFCWNDGSTFTFVTDLDAPNGRCVSIDVDDVSAGWHERIAESEWTLQWVTRKRDALFAGYLVDARTVVIRHDADGTVSEVPLPGIGWAAGFGGDRDDPDTWVQFMAFSQPPSLYRYDVDRRAIRAFRPPAITFDASGLRTEQVFYASADGTRVGMFLTHAAGLRTDGARPTLLYAYGGFGIPMIPWFWPLAIAWVERGGVFAVATIRGGGEYGEDWHRGGCGPNKQNSFDDFIAAAEWLVAEGYTRPDRLAVSGASNGGLLVGACITQRPDLFGAAHTDMGLLDMLHFDRVRVGLAIDSEYGSLDDPDDVARLLSYSPYHNVRRGTSYPATILTTGDHDELVMPWNSYKFAAALQASGSPRPVLLRVERDTGHGVAKATSKMLAEQSDILTFLLANVGERSALTGA